MFNSSFHSAVLLIMLVLVHLSCSRNESEPVRTGERELAYTAEVLFLNNQETVTTLLHVAVADDDNSRSAGLMNIYNMPGDAGMFFIFEDEQPRSFWMSNTPLALDLIFVNEALEIIGIHRNSQPFSQNRILSGGPAKYVIEVNAGYTLRHDITEGMQISYNLNP